MTNYRRKKRPTKETQVRFRTNKQIRHDEVRVIDEEGFVGLMSSQQALALATERDMDLIEINPKALPPVVKLLDYNKFKYQQQKAEAGKKAKPDKEKTIRVSVRIGPHDLEVQAKKTDQFIEKEHKVRLQVQMKGREKAFPDVAKEVMKNFVLLISQPYDFVQEPKLIGDSYFATLKPK